MARTLEFDRQKALERAMAFFWTHGYENASMRGLADAMEINLGSLYNTFTSKDECFALALEHYIATVIEPSLVGIDEGKNHVQSIKDYFAKVEKDSRSDTGTKGCFLLNTLLELSSRNPRLASTASNYFEKLERSFCDMLTKAKKAGHLKNGAKPDELAHYLLGVIMTIRTMSRMNAAPEMIADYRKTALSIL